MAEDLSEELGRNIPLSEMIQTLRSELKVAMKEGGGDELKFEVGEVELELQVRIQNDKEGKGGIKFWVLTAGAGGKKSDETVHTFRLKLKPVKGDSNAPVRVSDKVNGLPR